MLFLEDWILTDGAQVDDAMELRVKVKDNRKFYLNSILHDLSMEYLDFLPRIYESKLS